MHVLVSAHSGDISESHLPMCRRGRERGFVYGGLSDRACVQVCGGVGCLLQLFASVDAL